MELIIGDFDCLIVEHGTTGDIEPVRMLDLNVDFVQILVPCEWWGNFDWRVLLLIDLLKIRLVVGLHELSGLFGRN